MRKTIAHIVMTFVLKIYIMKALNQTIENLYSVFSHYTIESNLRDRCCDCCVTNYEIKSLLSKQLKNLNKDDIGHFMRSAITTYGDVNDYKHFLPRILELLVNNESLVDDFLTFEKLNYSQWLKWDLKEIKAIKKYFELLLQKSIENELTSVSDFIFLNLEYNDISLLEAIIIDSKSEKLLLKIVDDIIYEYQYPIDKRLSKIYSNKKILNKLELLFFRTKNENDANRISIAYTILEQNEN